MSVTAGYLPSSASESSGPIPLAPGVWVARDDLQFSFSRSSGPGGQAVNKLSTKAQLRVAVGALRGMDEAAQARLRQAAGRKLTADDAILIQAETHRSQHDNKRACLDKLGALVAAAMRPPKVRKKKKPTRSMIEKRLKSKRKASEKKTLRRTRRARGDME